MSEREQFLNALKENEDDMLVRLAFADWLDQQGEHEEADRHRKWTASKAWIVGLCEAFQPQDEFDDFEPMTYADIVEMALQAVADVEGGGRGSMDFGRNMELKYSGQWPEFWKHWCIVSGIPLPTEFHDKVGYTCGC